MFQVKNVTSHGLLERRVVVRTMDVDLEFTFPLFYTNNCRGNLVSCVLSSLQRKSSFERPRGLASSQYHYSFGDDVDYVKSAQAQYIVTKPYSWLKSNSDRSSRTLICFDPEPGRELDAILAIYSLYYGYESPCIQIPSEANEVTWERNLLRLFHPHTATLASCVREYRHFHNRYQEYWHAMGACGAASNAFLELLHRRRVSTWPNRSPLLQFSSLRGYIDGGLDVYTLDHAAPHGSHCYVVLSYGAIEDGIVLDWTYRQFDSKSPFPFIRRFRGTEIHEPWWKYSLTNPDDARRRCEYSAPVYDD